jgi:N-acetylmuramoyl-L-alanine amidase
MILLHIPSVKKLKQNMLINELPEELSRLRGNTGASAAGKSEWEVNLAIAEATKKILTEKNIDVDILPSTVPSLYWADVFVAIHADGSTDNSVSGFKVASPRRDYSGNASALVDQISSSYGSSTGLSMDTNITRNMTGYYAFAWWRYDHAVHPKTASAILETGFLTNAHDRTIIVTTPQKSAQGLANGILAYLSQKELI